MNYPSPRADYALTPQDTAVLNLLLESANNRTIGERLGISDLTVKHHIRNAKVRLGLTTRDGRTAVMVSYRGMLGQFKNMHSGDPSWLAKFTPREREILPLVASGLRNKPIAIKLGTTEQVIKNYLRSIYDKSGMSNSLELANWYLMNLGVQ